MSTERKKELRRQRQRRAKRLKLRKKSVRRPESAKQRPAAGAKA